MYLHDQAPHSTKGTEQAERCSTSKYLFHSQPLASVFNFCKELTVKGTMPKNMRGSIMVSGCTVCVPGNFNSPSQKQLKHNFSVQYFSPRSYVTRQTHPN